MTNPSATPAYETLLSELRPVLRPVAFLTAPSSEPRRPSHRPGRHGLTIVRSRDAS